MSRYLKLNSGAGPNNSATFIVNKSRRNYINLKSLNSDDVTDSVHKFMNENQVWNDKDTVMRTVRPINFCPSSTSQYHDISFMLKFYNDAVKVSEEPDCPFEEEAQVVAPHPKQIIVKQLSNPNIPHDEVNRPPQIDAQHKVGDTPPNKIEEIAEESDSQSFQEIMELSESSDSDNDNDKANDSDDSDDDDDDSSSDVIPVKKISKPMIQKLDKTKIPLKSSQKPEPNAKELKHLSKEKEPKQPLKDPKQALKEAKHAPKGPKIDPKIDPKKSTAGKISKARLQEITDEASDDSDEESETDSNEKESVEGSAISAGTESDDESEEFDEDEMSDASDADVELNEESGDDFEESDEEDSIEKINSKKPTKTLTKGKRAQAIKQVSKAPSKKTPGRKIKEVPKPMIKKKPDPKPAPKVISKGAPKKSMKRGRKPK